MASLVEVPDMNLVSVLASKEQLRIDAIFHHIRRAPFRRNHRVVPEMIPEGVRQLLGAAISLRLAFQLKRGGVHEDNAAGAVSSRRSERASVNAVGAGRNRVG